VVIFPVAVDVLVEGSYTSPRSLGLLKNIKVAKTLPFGSKVAEVANRSGNADAPVRLKVPVSGS
jgi:hypothetical protein